MDIKRKLTDNQVIIVLLLLLVILELLYDMHGGKGWVGIELVELLKTHSNVAR